jgi:hypothetical protein
LEFKPDNASISLTELKRAGSSSCNYITQQHFAGFEPSSREQVWLENACASAKMANSVSINILKKSCFSVSVTLEFMTP